MIPSLLTDTVTFDLERAVHYTLLWGLEGLELRAVGGPNDRVPYVNEHTLKRRLAESELDVVAVDPGAFGGHPGDRAGWMNELLGLKETLEFCRRTGCRRIVVSSFVDGDRPEFDQAVEALRQAANLVEGTATTICVLNERGSVAPTGEALAALLDAVDRPALRAAWSPAEAVISGGDADEGLQRLSGRVELVRCRNVGRGGNGWEPRPIDIGDIDWEAQLRLLQRDGFDGPLCLEVDIEPAAKQGLRGATEIIRLLRSLPRESNQET